MPSDAKKACEEHSACCGWAADQYGHLNLFVGADHQLYYHKRYKPFDEDPCHHLHPDKTQLWVLPEEFDRCGLKDVGPVISAVLREHHNPPIITFSFAEGARYMDMIYLIDAFDSLKVQIYIQRDMTSSEKNALSLLQMRNRKY